MVEKLSEHASFSDSSVEALGWRDEILQMMYWMHGEGFGREVTADDIRRFLDADRSRLLRWLEQLVEGGYVEVVAGEKYKLTAFGLREGKRRFLDEFEPFLKHGGHGECNDPDCECHEAESAEATCWVSKE